MTQPEFERAAEFICLATGRTQLADGIAWLAEDHPVADSTNWSLVLQALVIVEDSTDKYAGAMRRVVREAVRSEVDTSRVLFDADSLVHPSEYAKAVEELMRHSSEHTFSSLTPRSILRAQLSNPLAIECLCLAVGISYGDAKAWFKVGSAEWTLKQVTQLHKYLDDLVAGHSKSPIAGTVPARAIELVTGNRDGWSGLDHLRSDGVPYEVLLAQRAVGGAWLAHKNKTSSFTSNAVADSLCRELSQDGIDFRRAKTIGGTSKQGDLQKLCGIAKKQIGLVVLSGGRPVYAIAVSSARDGGTARANGDGLLQIPDTKLPLALVLTGRGWSLRPETARLAKKFHGRLFTEQTILDLVDSISEVVK